MAGTTNSSARRTVTVIESSDPRYEQQNFTEQVTDSIGLANTWYAGDIDSDFIGSSWLGNEDAWDLGFEHFDILDNFDHFNQLSAFDRHQ